jgi:membrane AbrB-like protein
MSDSAGPLAHWPRFAQWGLLLILSAIISTAMKAAGLPGAYMLGAMVAAILMESSGGMVRVPRLADAVAQAIIGCKIAGGISGSIVGTFSQHWPWFLGVAFSTLLAGGVLGWSISRLGFIPGSTAVWGLCPGAATVMMLMAEAFGANAQLVAFMQYLRVIFVALTASLVGRSGAHVTVMGPETPWFPPMHGTAFAATLAIALGGALVGRLTRLPAGLLLGPMILGSVLHATGLATIELPKWLLISSYVFLGWRIGLRFSRRILLEAARALPQTLLSIFLLIAFCGGVSMVLVKCLHIDPLTAYFATSPGGIDAAAIIASSAHSIDLAIVMALQMFRFVTVLAAGPAMARFVARHLPPDAALIGEEEPRIDDLAAKDAANANR